jgi:hypothetical protein
LFSAGLESGVLRIMEERCGMLGAMLELTSFQSTGSRAKVIHCVQCGSDVLVVFACSSKRVAGNVGSN